MTLSHSRDRKSTRLNSSHLGISYAVFCLKKRDLNRGLNRDLPRSRRPASRTSAGLASFPAGLLRCCPRGWPRHDPPAPPALFFFNDTATTEIYTLSLHDALPISSGSAGTCCRRWPTWSG